MLHRTWQTFGYMTKSCSESIPMAVLPMTTFGRARNHFILFNFLSGNSHLIYAQLGTDAPTLTSSNRSRRELGPRAEQAYWDAYIQHTNSIRSLFQPWSQLDERFHAFRLRHVCSKNQHLRHRGAEKMIGVPSRDAPGVPPTRVPGRAYCIAVS